MRLWLDPARMAQRGLTATGILNALAEQNVQVAAGQVGQPPSDAGQSYQISVRAVGRLTEPTRIRQHRAEVRDRRHAGAAEGRRPRGAGRRKLRLDFAIQWA